MYKEYFRLGEMPFSIAPDPRFLFMSDRHREAIAHLLYGVQGAGGIVLLTGEVGTGKTTICRTMLDQLPENIDVAFILNPRMSVEELLQTVCEEYHIDIAPGRTGIKAFVDAINTRLLDTNALGRRAILIIDEAQNLDPALLEQLRLLTNLETNTRKLLQIFLIGQPELQEMLARPEMRQVAQRVIARYHLTHLSQPEVKAYVAHRLTVSGASPSIFPDTLVKPLYQASGGVPRLINLICDRALLGTYVQGRQQVNAQTLRKAVKEILAVPRPQKPLRYRWAIIGVLLLSLAGTAIVTAPAFTGAASGWLATVPFAKLAAVVPNLPPAMPAQPASTIATPVATPQPTMPIEWPGNVARADSEALALQSLFKLYGIGFNPQSGRREDLCRQAEEHGMRCFAWHGGLSDLMLLDQPAVMRLSHVGGQEFSVTLVSLEPPVATLAIAGVERRVALTDLASLWSGQYLVIWKVPLGFRDVIKLNQRGPDVAWARRVLSAIDGGANDGSDLFDAELAQRVRAFQLTEGLQPVGFVGPKTAIRLNMRSGQIGPRLTAAKKG